MSKYTTEVRYICETAAGLTESMSGTMVDEIIEKAAPKIFGSFPMFDESYREHLEAAILRHYYTREIAYETAGLWKLNLTTRMREIMPYYNQLYASEKLTFNPLYTVYYKTTSHTDDVKNESGQTINGGRDQLTHTGEDVYTEERNDDHWNLYSDTPQGGVNGIKNASDPSLTSNGYLTNATRDMSGEEDGYTGTNAYDSQQTTSYGRTVTDSKKADNDTDTVTETAGYQGKSAAELLKEFRDSFLNIDLMIIKDLEDLFFQLW